MIPWMWDRPTTKASGYTGQHNTVKNEQTSFTKKGFENMIHIFGRQTPLWILDCVDIVVAAIKLTLNFNLIKFKFQLYIE
jgi:hypothetical protein